MKKLPTVNIKLINPIKMNGVGLEKYLSKK